MKLLGVVLVLASAAVAQRPYVVGGVALFPGGYQSVGYETGAGLLLNRSHFVLDSFAGYDNGRKTNDGGPVNPNGHDRILRGLAAYRRGSNYIGAGARWNELDTTNYAKTNWHPEIAVGHDIFPEDAIVPNFARIQCGWLFRAQHEVVRYPNATRCYSCGNQSSGVDISVWFPSPSNTKHKHVFTRMNITILAFHNNPSDHSLHFTDSTEFLVGYKF